HAPPLSSFSSSLSLSLSPFFSLLLTRFLSSCANVLSASAPGLLLNSHCARQPPHTHTFSHTHTHHQCSHTDTHTLTHTHDPHHVAHTHAHTHTLTHTPHTHTHTHTHTPSADIRNTESAINHQQHSETTWSAACD